MQCNAVEVTVHCSVHCTVQCSGVYSTVQWGTQCSAVEYNAAGLGSTVAWANRLIARVKWPFMVSLEPLLEVATGQCGV